MMRLQEQISKVEGIQANGETNIFDTVCSNAHNPVSYINVQESLEGQWL